MSSHTSMFKGVNSCSQGQIENLGVYTYPLGTFPLLAVAEHRHVEIVVGVVEIQVGGREEIGRLLVDAG